MEHKKVAKLTLVVNTLILLLVLGLWAFFDYLNVTFLSYFSIPTTFIYFFGYFLIYRNRLDIYVWMVYFWITLYMSITTVCLGYAFGFHLYCLSMILVMFAAEYISYKLHTGKMGALPISIVIAVVYLVSTSYVAFKGPIYERDQKYAAFFWIINSLTIICLIIYYSNFFVKAVISSEEKLIEAAHTDRLTHLYNRHYMIEHLRSLPDGDGKQVIAMSDIDNFKKINDTYGHNAGDAVLKAVAVRMTNICEGCCISRWGGEEFLLLIEDSREEAVDLLEKLRMSISEEPVIYENSEIRVTVTTGLAAREKARSIDEWIKDADNKLYFGKKNGKNRVIS